MSDIDYKALWEEELKRRHAVEQDKAHLVRQLAGLKEEGITLRRHSERSKSLLSRLTEMRRAVAARLLGADIVHNGIPTDWDSAAISAVEGADILLQVLYETRPNAREDRGNK